MPHADLAVLQRTPLLQGLPAEYLERLLLANPVATYRRDQAIFEEGSRDRSLFVVVAGAVAVKIDPAKLGTIERGSTELRTIRTFGPGESFGELDFVDGQGREATVIAAEDATRLLVISPRLFENLLPAQVILGNITRDLATKVRSTNQLLIETILSGYYLTVLVEDLVAGAYECDPIHPLETMLVVRNPEHFILSGPGQLLAAVPEKESLTVLFFAEPQVLRTMAGAGDPSGAVILKALFSLIKWGEISGRIDSAPFSYDIVAGTDRRAGSLRVQKTVADRVQTFALEWQVKGARHDTASDTATAGLVLHVYTDEARSTHSRARQLLDGIDMPVQKHVHATLAGNAAPGAGFRVMVVHHRTHETARTLQTLRALGYQLDTFIGIPYGNVGWDSVTMLDHAADHNYLSLRMVHDPVEPTSYQFDFAQSSFLDTQSERALLALYADPAVAGNYLPAMQALCEHRLEQALRTCRQRGERLIVYEDGGYIVAKIYEIYRNEGHRLHALVRSAVDDGTIVGIVEVTVAGERKNLQVIADNDGRPLLPALSNARSDIKAVFEAMGVAEAVVQAAASSLGRLGLPTFQTRRVAVIGGNGAIGTRLVEHVTKLHNSTTGVFAVDITDRPFSFPLDGDALPYAATRLEYHPLPRFLVADGCLPLILDGSYSERAFAPDDRAVTAAVTGFLRGDSRFLEAAITNGHPMAAPDLARLWQRVATETGYRPIEEAQLANGAGVRFVLANDGQRRTVTLLARSTVLTFESVARPIRSGVDTIIGSTGYPIFSATDLDAFLSRPNPSAEVDTLVLVSASSKDYEFRRAIDLLDALVKLQSAAAVPADQRLAWFGTFYRDGLAVLRGDDFAPLRSLFAAPLGIEEIGAFVATFPALAERIGLAGDDVASRHTRLADFVAAKVRRRLSIHKEIRPDIGSIYHLVVEGRPKRVVLLADGLVVNFFARHEKGVKTEFIDPVVTMQLLSVLQLSTTAIAPGLYKMDTQLRREDLDLFWRAIDDKCRPLSFDR